MNNSSPVAIVSHDAGGAEMLASYVAQSGIACRFVLAGPAVNIFKRRLGPIDTCTLTEGLSSCDTVLCGTGWQSDLEWSAIAQAQMSGKRAIAFLDHWVNYPERFIRNGVKHLPDEIWVGDEDAERLAEDCFLNIPIRLVRNPYFIDMQSEISRLGVKQLTAGKSKSVLFVGENISSHARLRYGDERYWGYTELDAIEYFFENINALGEQIGTVIIRPHPSDAPGKYAHVVSKYAGIARLSDGGSLLKEIAEADIVVGCQSTAMAVGLLAQKQVVSCIPPNGPGCLLPQKSIVHLRELLVSFGEQKNEGGA